MKNMAASMTSSWVMEEQKIRETLGGKPNSEELYVLVIKLVNPPTVAVRKCGL